MESQECNHFTRFVDLERSTWLPKTKIESAQNTTNTARTEPMFSSLEVSVQKNAVSVVTKMR